MDRDPQPEFVFGVDLDGVCADFYAAIRVIAAEWLGRNADDLTPDVSYSFAEWGLAPGEYEQLHHFAVTQRELFRSMQPLADAPAVLRRLSRRGVRIRIITHRLYIARFHRAAVTQTIDWLDHHGIPYWDLCFMREKGAVGADLYIDDSPENIEKLHAAGKRVIAFTNSTNRDLSLPGLLRAGTWQEVEALVASQLALPTLGHDAAA